MNEGVVKLFRRDAVVEDGGDDTLAAFRVWMVARVSDLGEGWRWWCGTLWLVYVCLQGSWLCV